MDRVTPNARSRIMSLVKPRHGRTTEKRLRAHLVSRAISGWKMNVPELLGKPDFVFSRTKIVIFVDGCFWHGCRRCKRPPTSNVDFWNLKVVVNRRRDLRVARALRRRGWTVFRVRECTLKNSARTKILLSRIEKLTKATASRGRVSRKT